MIRYTEKMSNFVSVEPSEILAICDDKTETSTCRTCSIFFRYIKLQSCRTERSHNSVAGKEHHQNATSVLLSNIIEVQTPVYNFWSLKLKPGHFTFALGIFSLHEGTQPQNKSFKQSIFTGTQFCLGLTL